MHVRVPRKPGIPRLLQRSPINVIDIAISIPITPVPVPKLLVRIVAIEGGVLTRVLQSIGMPRVEIHPVLCLV